MTTLSSTTLSVSSLHHAYTGCSRHLDTRRCLFWMEVSKPGQPQDLQSKRVKRISRPRTTSCPSWIKTSSGTMIRCCRLFRTRTTRSLSLTPVPLPALRVRPPSPEPACLLATCLAPRTYRSWNSLTCRRGSSTAMSIYLQRLHVRVWISSNCKRHLDQARKSFCRVEVVSVLVCFTLHWKNLGLSISRCLMAAGPNMRRVQRVLSSRINSSTDRSLHSVSRLHHRMYVVHDRNISEEMTLTTTAGDAIAYLRTTLCGTILWWNERTTEQRRQTQTKKEVLNADFFIALCFTNTGEGGWYGTRPYLKQGIKAALLSTRRSTARAFGRRPALLSRDLDLRACPCLLGKVALLIAAIRIIVRVRLCLVIV